jgi:hypothetical protein
MVLATPFDNRYSNDNWRATENEVAEWEQKKIWTSLAREGRLTNDRTQSQFMRTDAA